MTHVGLICVSPKTFFVFGIFIRIRLSLGLIPRPAGYLCEAFLFATTPS